MPNLKRIDIVRVELTKPILRTHGGDILAEGDNLGNRFGAELYSGGVAHAADDYTIVGYFIRSDGNTVIMNGTAEGNLVYVDLPEACYAHEGYFSLAIRATGQDGALTIRVIDGYVRKTQSGLYVDPGTVIPSIDDLLSYIGQMETASANAQAAIEAANAAAQEAAQAAAATDDAVSNASEAAEAALSAAEDANEAAEAANAAKDTIVSETAANANAAQAFATAAAASAQTAQDIAANFENAIVVDQSVIQDSPHAVSGGAVKTYVDSKRFYATATIGTEWNENVDGVSYDQLILVDGMMETDIPIIDLVTSNESAVAEAQLAAWACIYKIIAMPDSMVVVASQPTETAIDIQILGVR